MPPGRPRWPPAEPRPRSRASVPGALLVGAQRWPAAGISWRRTRNGQNSRPHRPAGGRRPNRRAGRGGGTHRRDLRRPKGPDVSVLASMQFHLHDQLPDPLHGSCRRGRRARLHRIRAASLRSLSEASIPAIAFSRHCSSRKISTPNCRDKVPPARHAKAAGQPHACASPSTAGQVPAGLPAKPGRGKRGRAKLALVYHRPINSNFVLKIVGHVPVLLGHFD